MFQTPDITNSGTSGHIYRPEIDGLRAVAVLGVLIYHADLFLFGRPVLPGGFLGVDVFFVISGYLLTSLISHQHLAGTFRFRTFYYNRVKRLLPALLTVCLGVMPFGFVLLSLDAAREFATSVIAAIFSVSNILFWLQDAYVAEPSQFKPMLHTWTLGVEEQFYLVVPLLLVATFAMSRRAPIWIIGALFFLSFVGAIVAGASHPVANFYLLTTRFWELAAGSLLAIIQVSRGARAAPTVLSDMLSWIGLGLILLSYVIASDTDTHPGWITLLPVLGTSLFVWSAVPQRSATRFLSMSAFLGIGLISYSLYLWHWPLIVFARIANGGILVPSMALGAIALSFGLSFLTYRFIETPFRRRFSAARVWAFVIGAGLTTVALCFLLIVRNSVAPVETPTADEVQATASAAAEEIEPSEMSLEVVLARSEAQYLEKDGRRCIGYIRQGRPKCVFDYMEDGDSEREYALIGDSHAGFMLGVSFEKKLRERGGVLTVLSPNACPFFGRHITVIRPERDRATLRCQEHQEWIYNWLSEKDPITVVLSSRYNLHLNGTRFDNEEGGVEPDKPTADLSVREGAPFETLDDAFAGAIQEITDLGHTVVLVYPVPEVGAHARRFYAQHPDLRGGESGEGFYALFNSVELTTSHDVYKTRSEPSFRMLDTVDDADGRLVRVYPDSVFCRSDGRCITRSATDILYFDDDHLSEPGADIVMEEVFAALER